jgi:transcriptional regulator of heat shock response
MTGRREKILKAIIEIFVQTASPVGSMVLKEIANFDISSATIRNEMAMLEEEGFLMQSHTSSGRIPTPAGYRMFVNDLVIDDTLRKRVLDSFLQERKKYFQKKREDQMVYDVISILTKMTNNIAFATIPSAKRTFFLGFSRIIREPEFASADETSAIFRVLEEDFYNLLLSLDVRDDVEIFIGKENIIDEIQSCSLLVSRFHALETDGFFGIIGPMRMDYAKNLLSIQAAQSLFDDLNSEYLSPFLL